MNQRIATIAALAIIGSTALGLETVAIHRVASGARELIGSSEAMAVGRAGRILGESIARSAVEHARTIAFDATLGVVRGLGAVYSAVQGHSRAVPAVVSPVPQARVIRMLREAAVVAPATKSHVVRVLREAVLEELEVDVDVKVDADPKCCRAKKARAAARAASRITT